MSPRAPSTTRVFSRSDTRPAFPPRGAANRPSRAGAAPADDRPARGGDPGFCPSAAYAHAAPWSRSDWATVVRPSSGRDVGASSHPVTATSSGMTRPAARTARTTPAACWSLIAAIASGGSAAVEQGGGDLLGLGRVVARAHRDGDVAPRDARGLGRLPVALQPVARHREQDVGDVRAAADPADPFAATAVGSPPQAAGRPRTRRRRPRGPPPGCRCSPAPARARRARRGPPPGASSPGRRPGPGRRPTWSRR